MASKMIPGEYTSEAILKVLLRKKESPPDRFAGLIAAFAVVMQKIQDNPETPLETLEVVTAQVQFIMYKLTIETNKRQMAKRKEDDE